jgi:hypothetical protein
VKERQKFFSFPREKGRERDIYHSISMSSYRGGKRHGARRLLHQREEEVGPHDDPSPSPAMSVESIESFVSVPGEKVLEQPLLMHRMVDHLVHQRRELRRSGGSVSIVDARELPELLPLQRPSIGALLKKIPPSLLRTIRPLHHCNPLLQQPIHPLRVCIAPQFLENLRQAVDAQLTCDDNALLVQPSSNDQQQRLVSEQRKAAFENELRWRFNQEQRELAEQQLTENKNQSTPFVAGLHMSWLRENLEADFRRLLPELHPDVYLSFCT